MQKGDIYVFRFEFFTFNFEPFCSVKTALSMNNNNFDNALSMLVSQSSKAEVRIYDVILNDISIFKDNPLRHFLRQSRS
jgi:hypothetical protein